MVAGRVVGSSGMNCSMDPQSLSPGYRLRAGRQRHRRVQPERRGAVLTFDEVESTTGRADRSPAALPCSFFRRDRPRTTCRARGFTCRAVRSRSGRRGRRGRWRGRGRGEREGDGVAGAVGLDECEVWCEAGDAGLAVGGAQRLHHRGRRVSAMPDVRAHRRDPRSLATR